jgi:hypothetical protein
MKQDQMVLIDVFTGTEYETSTRLEMQHSLNEIERANGSSLRWVSVRLLGDHKIETLAALSRAIKYRRLQKPKKSNCCFGD